MEAETQGIRYSNFDQRLRYLLLRLANHEGNVSLGKALYAASQVELTSSTSHSWVFQIITCWLLAGANKQTIAKVRAKI